ncbi:DDE-type integrase/transposase/recombinase [Flavihumibacter solisilvae]|uniref:DDE-type integrase/transposase/recombinase n=1 Tax=Flavihumibacter solisilvae TaxID=1349421 RepID=UPI00068A5FC6|nr:DDE-type integrase/transposase/recombinase [Flavihumibacter solisilvae]
MTGLNFQISYSGQQGRKPSTHTVMQDGTVVANNSVVIAIKFYLGIEFVDYGYQKMTASLRFEGFIINEKKVYRLMTESGLLYSSKFTSKTTGRKFVQFYTQQADAPMKQLCMDIKYLHIHGAGRNALVLTVLDVYSRRKLGQLLWWRMRKHQVNWLLSQILAKHRVEGITLRKDNGSQFIAHLIREFLQEQGINQEFTRVATPEENAFIEAYHSLLERSVEQRYEFESIYEAGLALNRWKKFYNEQRLHGSLGNKTPMQVWDEHYRSVEPLGPPLAAKPEEKSRPAILEHVGHAIAAPYSLYFSGGGATFATSGETHKNYLTNIDLLSSF